MHSISSAREPVAQPALAAHKVLLFIPHLEQGGAERQILELMRRLPPRFQTALCLYDLDDPTQVHYRAYLDPTSPPRSLGVKRMGVTGLRRLVDVLRTEQPTILHSYRDKANFWARLATFSAPVPIVLTSVRNRKQGIKFAIAEFLLQGRSDRILTNSRGIVEELVSWGRVAPRRIQVISNFVDLEHFHPPTPEQRELARRQHGFAPEDTVLLLPGRLAVQKHQLGLAVALWRLRRAGRLPARVRVVLAGRRRDRFYSRLVPLAMRALKVADTVTFLEPVTDMVRLYHAADALVMPSLFEGMSNAVLEAHACGLPTIVSYAANRDDIVVDGVTGFQVPTYRTRPLADAIARMVALAPEERRAMGARGREHVARRFHPDRVLAEMVALYDELLAHKGLA